MITSKEEYMESVSETGRLWLCEFYEYMSLAYPRLGYVMFRQRPMYKVGQSYVMFTAADSHFSVHTLNFDLIERFKQAFPKSGQSKGCVNIKYTSSEAKPLLKSLCDQVITLNLSDNPPAVDVTPALPYGEHLDKVFSKSYAHWRDLYEGLLGRAKAVLPEFVEYFPALGILWKHNATFAQVKCTKAALRLDFFADQAYPERNPLTIIHLSAHRTRHTVAIAHEDELAPVIPWIEESYHLTRKK